MQKDDGIYVINFWASWCKPCVIEMPAFETLANNFHLKKVEQNPLKKTDLSCSGIFNRGDIEKPNE
jgi:thiol-disulfide isomerase/thioredoxin